MTTTHEPWLFFEVAKTRLAVPALSVDQVFPLGVVTPVPLTPPAIRGLVSLRGAALPLLDLCAFFSLAQPSSGQTDSGQTVLACHTKAFRVGLLCHRAHGIRHVEPDQTIPPRLAQPELLRSLAHAELEDERGLNVLLDIDAMLEAACVG